jgi:MFS family permease
LWIEHKNKRDNILKKTENKLALLFSSTYRKIFILSLVLAIFDMSAYWFTYSWMPGYLHEQRHFSLAKSAAWMLITQSGGFIGYFTFGYAADRFGRRPAYTIYSFIMAAGLVMITLLWDVIVVYNWLILLFMFTVGFGTGMFGGYGPLFSELFPTKIRRYCTWEPHSILPGVQFLTPVVMHDCEGLQLERRHFIASIFAVLTGLWIWTFPETKGRILEA